MIRTLAALSVLAGSALVCAAQDHTLLATPTTV